MSKLPHKADGHLEHVAGLGFLGGRLAAATAGEQPGRTDHDGVDHGLEPALVAVELDHGEDERPEVVHATDHRSQVADHGSQITVAGQ